MFRIGRGKFFNAILDSGRTNFFFESPFRIARTLAELAQLSPDSKIAVIREATKLHEEIIRGTAADVANLKRDWKGEFVIGLYPVVSDADAAQSQCVEDDGE